MVTKTRTRTRKASGDRCGICLTELNMRRILICLECDKKYSPKRAYPIVEWSEKVMELPEVKRARAKNILIYGEPMYGGG